MINLSLGGLRDPRRPDRDTYSALEAAAIRYAYTRGAVVVAAVGNADQAPTSPWPYASYPAALPHVVGVSALARDGSVLPFSNRDPIYNDIAAPGQDIVSTFPRQLTNDRPTCDEQGYSPCGPRSTAAPRGRRSRRRRSQPPRRSCSPRGRRSSRTRSRVSSSARRWTRTHRRAVAAARCNAIRSAAGDGSTSRSRRDASGPLPARPVRDERRRGPLATPLRVPRASFTATLDFWDDPTDVYKTYRPPWPAPDRHGRRAARKDTNLVLWRPGTRHVEGLAPSVQRQRAAQSARRGSRERITYRASVPGWYYVQVRISSRDAGAYRLAFTKR